MRTTHVSLCNAIRRKLTALSAKRERAVLLRAKYEAKVSVTAEEVAALDAQIDLLQATLCQFDPDAAPPASASPAATTSPVVTSPAATSSPAATAYPPKNPIPAQMRALYPTLPVQTWWEAQCREPIPEGFVPQPAPHGSLYATLFEHLVAIAPHRALTDDELYDKRLADHEHLWLLNHADKLLKDRIEMEEGTKATLESGARL